jgi:hypothetical protein
LKLPCEETSELPAFAALLLVAHVPGATQSRRDVRPFDAASNAEATQICGVQYSISNRDSKRLEIVLKSDRVVAIIAQAFRVRASRIRANEPERKSACERPVNFSVSSGVTAPQLIPRKK